MAENPEKSKRPHFIYLIMNNPFIDGGIYRFEGVGSWEGRFWTVEGVGRNDQLRFPHSPENPTAEQILKTQFQVRKKGDFMTFESMSNPGYFLFPIRPAGMPWVVGLKHGPPPSDASDFEFRYANPITRNAENFSIVPRKNQAWTVGCGFPGGIGMHMPGAFGYTEVGHWKGAFTARLVPARRKNQADMTATEWTKFINALNSFRATSAKYPAYSDFTTAHQHTAPSWGAHGAPNFLTWHRDYIQHFEARLRSYDPSVFVPYWDWVTDLRIPAELDNPADWGVTRTLGAGQSINTVMTPQQLTDLLAEDNFCSFSNQLESYHGSPHVQIGGEMGGMGSPADPLFWLHHCFIDKIFADWEAQHSSIQSTNITDEQIRAEATRLANLPQPNQRWNNWIREVEQNGSINWSTQQLEPEPFLSRTNAGVWNTESLGYTYVPSEARVATGSSA